MSHKRSTTAEHPTPTTGLHLVVGALDAQEAAKSAACNRDAERLIETAYERAARMAVARELAQLRAEVEAADLALRVQKAAAEQARRAADSMSALHKELLENIAQPAFTLSPSLDIVAGNRAAASLAGTPASLEALLAPASTDALRASVGAACSRGTLSLRVTTTDGGQFTAALLPIWRIPGALEGFHLLLAE